MRTCIGEARKRQQAARGAAHSRRRVLVILLCRRTERLEKGEGCAGTAAGRIHTHLRGRLQASYSVGRLVPFRESRFPQVGLFESSRIGCCRIRARAGRVRPWTEVGDRQIGERQQEIGEVALGIDREDRDPVDRRLFDQDDAKPGLTASGHSHADRVREKVFRIVQDGFGHSRTIIQVVAFAEVEEAELFV